jgi:hypothetical protein
MSFSRMWVIALLVGCDQTASMPPPMHDAVDADDRVPMTAPPAPLVDAGGDDVMPVVTIEDGGDATDAAVSASNTACSSGECNLLDPLTCGAGEGCLWLLGDDGEPTSGCVQAGSGADGDPCESPLDCGPGLDCTSTDGEGTCRRYCCELNGTAGCPAGQFCRVALVTDADPLGEVALCDRCDRCDPTRVEACGPGFGCFPLPGPGSCMACLPAGDASVGMPCSVAMDCAAGTACLRLEDDGNQICRQFCALSEDEPCTRGACVASDGAGLPDNLGICIERN